jgi:hypothetical protein
VRPRHFVRAESPTRQPLEDAVRGAAIESATVSEV